jgi:hypothetical protein
VTSSRAAKRTVWLAALGLAAAATPPALAAEGGAPPLPDPGALAAGIIEQAGAGDTLPTLPIDLPAAEPLELPAAPAQQAAEEPAQTGADAAPPPVPVADAAPQPAPEAAPEPPVVAPDEPPPVAVQQEPANVNVSVRIDSPGDDGAVTQVNVAVAPSPGQYQSSSPRYQPVVPAPDPPASEPDPVEEPIERSEPAWEWSWNWDCGGGAHDPVALPAGVPAENWIWIWNWNCGGGSGATENNAAESADGYQPGTVQYRPVNINVSIRINSPGGNGSVVQTNVAVGVSLPASAPSIPLPPPAPAPSPAPAPVPAPAPAPAEPPAEAAPPPSDGSAPPETAEPPAAEVPLLSGSPPAHDCCLLPEPRGAAPVSERPASILAGGGVPTATGIAILPGDTVAVAARLELRLRRAVTLRVAPPRATARAGQPRRQQPSPQSRPSEQDPTAATQSALGLAPVGGPERSLPFAALVLLAFAFASADSSLTSVRSRPTRGTDVDDPPDRPG